MPASFFAADDCSNVGYRSTASWVVLASVLFHATLFLEVTEHAVQVVRLDFHRLGDVRGADAGLRLDQLHRLVGAGAATAFTASARAAASAAGGGGGAAGGAGRFAGAAAFRAAGAATGDFAAELGQGPLEAIALLVEVLEATLYELPGLIEHVAGGGHLVPFHPKFRSDPRGGVCQSHTHCDGSLLKIEGIFQLCGEENARSAWHSGQSGSLRELDGEALRVAEDTNSLDDAVADLDAQDADEAPAGTVHSHSRVAVD